MSRLAHALWYLYLLAIVFLFRCSIDSVRSGDLWHAAGLTAAAALVGIALIRECLADDERHAAGRTGRPPLPRRTPGAELTVAAALAAACCETWWASAGADHDPATCTRRNA
jgi:hypothetical protein